MALKKTATAQNIVENAKISELVLKIFEYIWELNPGK